MSKIPKPKISTKLFLLFIPVAYISYLFHEFGHWSVGELLGNDMVYNLNYVWPESGQYLDASHDLFISIGGPAFSILQSLIFLIILEKYRSIYLYPFIFFPLFMRFFALVFGGFSKQDEARISAILDIGTYTIAIILVLVLLLFVIRASYLLKINLKSNAYYFTISTLCTLMVIGSYKFLL